MDESQEAELLFIGSLVVGGCDESLVEHLLSGLQKPYCYRIERVYYDWCVQAWRLIPEKPDPEEMFEQWLDDLVHDENMEELESVQEKIEDAILRLTKQTEK